MEDLSRISFNDTLTHLNSDPQGLTYGEAEARQDQYGSNALEKKQGNTFFAIIKKQIMSPLVFILIIAGVLAFLLGEHLDAAVISAVFVLNLTIGIVQEGRASRAFEKLRDSQERVARVIREGARKTISSEELVPGDLLLLEAGSYVPADVRIGDAHNLTINEASLTGESTAVRKTTEPLDEELVVSDKTNMAWMGTLVESGSGKGVVVATGNDTELGRIATHLTDQPEEKTPIQKRIETLARSIAAAIAGIIVLIFLLGLSRGEAVTEMLLISITIAVAVLPEGLPAAVTIVLALGMEAILKKGGLVRNLLAAETLGSTTTILTDKTGTLTEARMELTALITTADLDQPPPEDHVFSDEEQELLRGAIRASDAYLVTTEDGEQYAEGRPMERAIVDAGVEHKLYEEATSEDFRRIDFVPFESQNRFAASLNAHPSGEDGPRRVYITGAPEVLLSHANNALEDETQTPLTDELREAFESYIEQLSKKGRRFIALAYKNTDTDDLATEREHPEQTLENITFVGLLAFTDPVREDVPHAIEETRLAGVDIKMLTGDHPHTALAVAQEVGLATEDSTVIHGSDLTDLSDEELVTTLQKHSVFARVLPEQKLRIARLLKSQGEIVAMTGDGINDAPALRNADIGVALGSGTEVAKESSDLILLKNSFSVITKAIEEGRRIVDNLKKIVTFMLSTNVTELLLLVSTLVLALPLPLLPTQILWVNIIGQGLLDFALAFEPAEKDAMKRDPRGSSNSHIITPKLLRLVVMIGVITSGALLGLYYYLLQTGTAIEEIRTIMFIALALSSFFVAFSFKSLSKPIWRERLFSNLFLVGSLIISIALLVLSLTYPPLQTLFTLTPLTLTEFGLLAIFAFANLLIIETVKYFTFVRESAAKTY